MKNAAIKLLSGLVTFTLMLGVGPVPQLNAQETNWEEVLTQIYEANKEMVSMEGNGTINLEVQDMLSGDVSMNFQYNLDPVFAADVSGAIDALLYSENAEGELESFPINFSGQAVIADRMAYFFDGSSWYTEDISEAYDMFAEQFQAGLDQANQMTAEQRVEMTMKYYDLTETDTEYVTTLKADINEEEFWADVEEMLDMEKIKADAIEQVIEQGEAQGEELTDEMQAKVEEQLNLAFEAGKSIVFKFINRAEMRYSKDTYYLTGLMVEMSMNDQDVNDLMLEMGMEEEALLPVDSFNMTMSMEMNFMNHAQTFDIQVPAEALEAAMPMESDTEEDDAMFETEDTAE